MSMENAPIVMMEDDEMMMEEESMETGNPMMANLSFFSVALFGAISTGLNGFKFTGDETFYDLWETALATDDVTNWWKFAN